MNLKSKLYILLLLVLMKSLLHSNQYEYLIEHYYSLLENPHSLNDAFNMMDRSVDFSTYKDWYNEVDSIYVGDVSYVDDMQYRYIVYISENNKRYFYSVTAYFEIYLDKYLRIKKTKSLSIPQPYSDEQLLFIDYMKKNEIQDITLESIKNDEYSALVYYTNKLGSRIKFKVLNGEININDTQEVVNKYKVREICKVNDVVCIEYESGLRVPKQKVKQITINHLNNKPSIYKYGRQKISFKYMNDDITISEISNLKLPASESESIQIFMYKQLVDTILIPADVTSIDIEIYGYNIASYKIEKLLRNGQMSEITALLKDSNFLPVSGIDLYLANLVNNKEFDKVLMLILNGAPYSFEIYPDKWDLHQRILHSRNYEVIESFLKSLSVEEINQPIFYRENFYEPIEITNYLIFKANTDFQTIELFKKYGADLDVVYEGKNFYNTDSYSIIRKKIVRDEDEYKIASWYEEVKN